MSPNTWSAWSPYTILPFPTIHFFTMTSTALPASTNAPFLSPLPHISTRQLLIISLFSAPLGARVRLTSQKPTVYSSVEKKSLTLAGFKTRITGFVRSAIKSPRKALYVDQRSLRRRNDLNNVPVLQRVVPAYAHPGVDVVRVQEVLSEVRVQAISKIERCRSRRHKEAVRQHTSFRVFELAYPAGEDRYVLEEVEGRLV